MKRYSVEVHGFPVEIFQAETRGKAMYQAYRRFRDSGRNWTFHDFLIETTARLIR